MADYRQRCADAAMQAFTRHATVCEHSQIIPIGAIVDAVLAVRDNELEQLRDRGDTYDAEARHWVGEVLALTDLLRDLADPVPCRHDGGCQTHGWRKTDPSCPHARAHAVLQDTPRGGQALPSPLAPPTSRSSEHVTLLLTFRSPAPAAVVLEHVLRAINRTLPYELTDATCERFDLDEVGE
ncbi:hypothetical protein AB0L05_27810 [Nonomuraea pusilla]|uniref:hypothetical protein n=1 Tax=Nonomuraea pusilla TaxID=46177 RepID=UPI003317C555